MVGGDGRPHPLLDRRQVVRGEGPGQQEVVIEPVRDDRPDPKLGPREQVQDRLGQDVRGAVAHRPERVARRAVVHELGGAPALLDLEQLVLERDRLVVRHVISSGNQKPLVRHQDERSAPAVPPAFTGVHGPAPSCVALTGDARIGSPIAHGWCRSGSTVGLAARARLSADR
jgi:hypothetical protein